MSNPVIKFKKKLVPDTKGTLESMKIGDRITISTKDAKTTAIRTAVRRIPNMTFHVTEKDSTKINKKKADNYELST